MAFSSLVRHNIDAEEGTICFPAKPGVIAVDFFGVVVIQGHFFDQVELGVQLDQAVVFGDHVDVLLGWGERAPGDAVIVLCPHFHLPLLGYGDDGPVLCHHQGHFGVDQILQQHDGLSLKLLDGSSGVPHEGIPLLRTVLNEV